MLYVFRASNCQEKMKFSVEDSFSICEQIQSFLWVFSYLLKKFLTENFIFCAVLVLSFSSITLLRCKWVWLFWEKSSYEFTNIVWGLDKFRAECQSSALMRAKPLCACSGAQTKTLDLQIYSRAGQTMRKL